MNKNICISLKSLYEKKGECLHYGGCIEFYNDGKSDYYDLRHPEIGTIVCCDGEECEVISEDKEKLVLSNISTKIEFCLTQEEYAVAVYN